MSDARWFEIEEDVAASRRQFARAGELFGQGGFAGDDLASYRARMALLHAMQAGHTSLESALVRILRLVGEEAPTGADWLADLIRRAARVVAGRPAVISGRIEAAADETRRFRHIAMRSYESFDAARAGPAVEAAGLLAGEFAKAVTAFKSRIDP